MRLQPNRVVQYETNNQDSVHFMQLQPEVAQPGTEAPSHQAWREFSCLDKVVLVLSLVVDLLLSLYISALLLSVIGLTWSDLGARAGHQVTTRSPLSSGPGAC